MLNTRKDNVIKNTVSRMPIHAVIPLLHEVGECVSCMLYGCSNLAGENPSYVSLFLAIKLVW